MQLIYVAGRFRSDTHYQIHLNIIHAEARALDLWKQGWAVICPHLNTQNFQGECADDVWLNGCLEIVKRCDAIYMLKGWELSEGSKEELKLAQELGLEVYYEP